MEKTTNIDSTSEFDHNYWNELDTTTKFYYESFLQGDGYVKSSDNTIGVDLAIKDYNWLVNYTQNLHINNKISLRDERPKKNSITASVRKKDKQWVKDLSKYGMVPRKTGKETLPVDFASSPSEMSSILLGIFDSDGSVYKENKSQRYRVSFCGNETVCNQVNTILSDYVGIEPNKMTLSNKKCSFIWSSSHGAKADLVKLYDFMYMNKELENCYLSRKHHKFTTFMLDATRTVV